MKININKKLLKKMLLVAGVSFILSGCGRDNTPDSIPFAEMQTGDDVVDPIYDDSYDDIEQDNPEEDSENHEMRGILVSSSAELNDYFTDTVDFSDVGDVIRANSNLSQQEKKYFLELVQRLEEKAPTVDLRCLYENFKLVDVKMEKQKNSATMATFSAENHKITVFQDERFNYTHEGIHMMNKLYLPQEDKGIILMRNFSLDQDESVSFLKEGFTAWFNDYLFGDEKGYSIQRSDMNIIKYILDLTDDEFIQLYTGENYTSITKLLGQYLNGEEITTWMDISQQEANDSIDFSQINKKYSLLLKACITSKGGKVDSDELYQIITLLSNSYNQYSGAPEEIAAMHHEFMEELAERLDYTNNDIQIQDTNENPISYCDIDQMYFIQHENGDLTLAEKYLDSHANERYYSTFSYKAKDNDVIISINELLNYEAEHHDCYTIFDLATIYSEYSSEYELGSKGARQKTP